MKTKQSFILCATDFSNRAHAASVVAAKFAQSTPGRLSLVHATESSRSNVLDILRDRLENEAEALRKNGAVVDAVLLQGRKPSKVLLDFIRERGPALVVVAGPVKGVLDRWALGSFSEQIAEASPVPTFVVRSPEVFDQWDWTKSRLSVLLSLDLTASSDVVLRWAKLFGRAGPCDFIASHINFRSPTSDELVYPLSSLVNPRGVQERLERELRKRIRDQMGDSAVEVLVRPNFGDPGPILVEVAREKKVHVIAVGTHQRQGIHRLAQFSVSRSILHQTEANVMCIPVTAKFDPREAHIPEFRRVLVATDFSEVGNTAIPVACGACAADGVVKIIHVVSPRAAERNGGLRWSSDLRLRMRELFPDEMAGGRRQPESEVITHGNVAQAICAEAERFGADLVCLTSHGWGASRAFQGSVAKAVLKQIRRPLLVVRRPE